MKRMLSWVLLAVMMAAGFALAEDFVPSPALENVLDIIVYTIDEETGVKTIEEVENVETVAAAVSELAALAGNGKPLVENMDEAGRESLASVFPEGTVLEDVQMGRLATTKITFFDETKETEEVRIDFADKYPQDSTIACAIGILKTAAEAETAEAETSEAATAEAEQVRRITLPGCESADWIVVPAKVGENGEVIVYLDRAAQKIIDGREIMITVLEA